MTLNGQVVRLRQYSDKIRSLAKRLDDTNVRIFAAMQKHGPRNLLEVSRRTGIPFTSVYNRVGKLESAAGPLVHLVPSVSRLGLVSLTVVSNAKPGYEEAVTQALQMPGYTSSITRSEGGFTHHSNHIVPVTHLPQYRRYLKEISEKGLTTSSTVFTTSDYRPNLLNFRYYDAEAKEWRFPWNVWLRGALQQRRMKLLVDPASYPISFDKKDLVIVKELQKNGRKTFADLAPILGMTLQGVKYRYDRKLVAGGVLENFSIDVTPFPPEMSASYKIQLEFANKVAMNRFSSNIPELFFVIGYSKVLKREDMLLRVYIPDSQVGNLFGFLSELCKRRAIAAYSSLRLRSETEEKKTIPFSLFDDEKGWMFDYKRSVSKLRQLT